MSMRVSINCLSVFGILALVSAASLAQDRLVINVNKARTSSSSSKVIHYQGTGSVRHSDQRTYNSAQERSSVEGAQDRAEGKQAEARRTRTSQYRSDGQAQGRRSAEASERHGSVRLDTIR